MNEFINLAIAEAKKGLRKNHGGPFGAIIVKDGKVISSAHNEVLKNNDPTCHAEMLAIKKAAKKSKTFDLSGCEIYSLSEPCPMCLAAIYWAKIKKINYCCSKEEAEKIGFADNFIYQAMCGNVKDDSLIINKLDESEGLKVFQEWANKEDKIQY